MKVTKEQEELKDQICEMYIDQDIQPKNIAIQLGLKTRQVYNILRGRKQIGVDLEYNPLKEIVGIHFGHKTATYNDSKDEMDHHSNYTPTFSWSDLSRTEKSIVINPNHLINFKETLKNLQKPW